MEFVPLQILQQQNESVSAQISLFERRKIPQFIETKQKERLSKALDLAGKTILQTCVLQSPTINMLKIKVVCSQGIGYIPCSQFVNGITGRHLCPDGSSSGFIFSF